MHEYQGYFHFKSYISCRKQQTVFSTENASIQKRKKNVIFPYRIGKNSIIFCTEKIAHRVRSQAGTVPPGHILAPRPGSEGRWRSSSGNRRSRSGSQRPDGQKRTSCLFRNSLIEIFFLGFVFFYLFYFHLGSFLDNLFCRHIPVYILDELLFCHLGWVFSLFRHLCLYLGWVLLKFINNCSQNLKYMWNNLCIKC